MDPPTPLPAASTLSGATIQTAERNEFYNTGGNTTKIIVQNFTIDPGSTHAEAEEVSGQSGESCENPVSNTHSGFDIYAFISIFLSLIFNRTQSPSGAEETTCLDDPPVIVSEIPLDDSLALSIPEAFNSPSHRYTRSILEKGIGYPLYEPQPDCDPSSEYWREGVRIGDVGIVTADGIFDFLFNVCPSQNPSINPPTIPDDFNEVLDCHVRIVEHFQLKTRLFSSGVNRTKDPGGSYTCLGPNGAILELPAGATRFEAKDKLPLKRLAARDAEKWYRYAMLNMGRDAQNGSLYLVTACIKSTYWGIAVFERTSAPDCLRFIIDEGLEEQNQISRSKYRWEGSGAFIARVTPNPNSPSSNDGDALNQCAFLRGYKIALRKDIWDNLEDPQSTTTIYTTASQSANKGNKSTRKGNPGEQNDCSQTEFGSSRSAAGMTSLAQGGIEHGAMAFPAEPERVTVHADFSLSPVHPSDLINAVLLSQKSDAKVALTHDDDWCDMLQDVHCGTQLETDNTDQQQDFSTLKYENLPRIALSYTTRLDEFDCVSLERTGQLKSDLPDYELLFGQATQVDDAKTNGLAKAFSDLLSLRRNATTAVDKARLFSPDAKGTSDVLKSYNRSEIDDDSLKTTVATAVDKARLFSSNALDNNPLIPTTAAAAEKCPRFRILLVGRSGVGKSSLINAIFKTSLAAVEDHQAGVTSIEREITSPYNEYLVVHDSGEHEPGDPYSLMAIKNFITARCNATNVSEKLHAVWLCITTPFSNARVLETGDEEILRLKKLGVPVIIVFTKYDLLLSVAKRELIRKGSVGMGDEIITKSADLARRMFEVQCIPPLKQLEKKTSEKIPYICVSSRYEETLEKLVQSTLKNISSSKQSQQIKPLFKRLSESISKREKDIPDEDHTVFPTEDYSDLRMLMLATSQRVDINSKIAASISVGKRKYWRGLVSGLHFRNNTIWRCLQVIHTDIINVWNIRGMSQYLLSDGFRQKMTVIVSDLSPDVPGRRWTSTTPAELLAKVGDQIVSAGAGAVVAAPIAASMGLVSWVYEIYKQAPHIIRCLMGYIVDLTVIVQTLFKISAQDRDGNVEMTRVEEILNNFAGSQIKETVHAEIRTFVNGLRTRLERDSISEKIASLIYFNKDAELLFT